MDSSRRWEATAISSTAPSNAIWCLPDGSRNPLTFRTNWRAAARISSSLATTSAWRRVLMLRHTRQRYGRVDPALSLAVFRQLGQLRRRQAARIEPGTLEHRVCQPIVSALGEIAHRIRARGHQLPEAK